MTFLPARSRSISRQCCPQIFKIGQNINGNDMIQLTWFLEWVGKPTISISQFKFIKIRLLIASPQVIIISIWSHQCDHVTHITCWLSEQSFMTEVRARDLLNLLIGRDHIDIIILIWSHQVLVDSPQIPSRLRSG